MSPVALPETAKQASNLRSFGRLFDPGGRPSLDDVVTALWGAGDAGGSCLVCGAVLPGPAQEAGEAPRLCASCGSRLE